mgnify:CR=1 FL=1
MSPYNLRKQDLYQSQSDSESSLETNDAMKANFTESADNVARTLQKIKKNISEKNYSSITKSLEDLEDYYERCIQVRIMHCKTITEDAAEAATKAADVNETLTKRVIKVRDAALRRKFQARFWMGAYALREIEVWFPGITRAAFIGWVVPIVREVILGASTHAVVARTMMMTVLVGQVLASISIVQKIKKVAGFIF